MSFDPKKDSASAIIEADAIVIRIPLDNLQSILDGGFKCRVFDKRYIVTNVNIAAKDICNVLNYEDEEGLTKVHCLFDAAINEAINQGSEGLD